MNYPTLEEVEAATHEELAGWYRFLPSPGLAAIKDPRKTDMEISRAIEREALIMSRIVDKFNSLGGFTPALSKSIGWKEWPNV